MYIAHAVADECGDGYAVFVAPSQSVLLTAPLTSFIDYTTTEGIRPVLVTSAAAQLSPFVSLAMRRAGGLWAVRGASGATYDGLSGYRIEAFADLWAQHGTDRERLKGFDRWIPNPGGMLMFDVFAHQRAAAETQVGELSASLIDSLGGAPADVWGLCEPLVAPYDASRITEVARRGMPDSEVIHLRSQDGTFCDTIVARTRRGLLEHVKGGVPIGDYPRGIAEVVAAASRALEAAADRFQPTIGFVSLAEAGDSLAQGASAKRPEVPLAVVIGPRGVHDLRLDADQLARRHDVTLLGRKRIPSLLVRFSDPDAGLWAQLIAFGHDLGMDRLATAVGLGKVG